MKHTKGPWEIEGLVESNGVGAQRIVAPCNTYAIADVYQAAERGGVSEANARLIAAAPELLRVCQVLRDEIISHGPHGDQVNLRMLELVITKAEGTEK